MIIKLIRQQRCKSWWIRLTMVTTRLRYTARVGFLVSDGIHGELTDVLLWLEDYYIHLGREEAQQRHTGTQTDWHTQCCCLYLQINKQIIQLYSISEQNRNYVTHYNGIPQMVFDSSVSKIRLCQCVIRHFKKINSKVRW